MEERRAGKGPGPWAAAGAGATAALPRMEDPARFCFRISAATVTIPANVS